MVQPLKSKEIIIQKLKKIIQSHEEIIFAYLFGSFTDQEVYNDLDVAIYCDEDHPLVSDLFYDVSLSREIEKAVQIPVDIIVLNHAPDRLVYRASKGFLLKDKNQALRFDFLLLRWKKCLDFQEVLKKYRQELMNAH